MQTISIGAPIIYASPAAQTQKRMPVSCALLVIKRRRPKSVHLHAFDAVYIRYIYIFVCEAAVFWISIRARNHVPFRALWLDFTRFCCVFVVFLLLFRLVFYFSFSFLNSVQTIHLGWPQLFFKYVYLNIHIEKFGLCAHIYHRLIC